MTNKHTTYLCIIAILAAILVAATSCRTKREVVNTSTSLEVKEDKQLFADILTQRTTYETFNSKITISLINGSSSRSSKATMKIIRDNALQISVQPIFGYEFFRLQIDNDSLTLLDRMNKRYVKESIADMKKRYPTAFDLVTLQELVTNGIFVAGKREVKPADYSKFKYATQANMYYLKSKDEVSGIEYFFSVNAADRVIFTNMANSEKQYSLQWDYNNFSYLADRQLFPYSMNVRLSTESRKAEVGIQFNDVVLNQPMELQAAVPNGYKKMAFDDVLNILIVNK